MSALSKNELGRTFFMPFFLRKKAIFDYFSAFSGSQFWAELTLKQHTAAGVLF
jgi:hypothetical protein